MADPEDTIAADVVIPPPELTIPPPDVPPPPDLTSLPPVVQPERRAVIWPVVGGVVAALAGFGLAQVVPNGWPMGQTTTLETQLAAEITQVKALKSQVLELAQRLDAAQTLADRVAKLEAAPAPVATAPDLSALETRIASLETRPASGGDPAAVAQLRAEIEVLKANGAGIVSPEVQAGLDAKVKDTEAKLSAIEESAKTSAAATMAHAALGQIAAALDSGAPYPAALAELQGMALPAVLTDHAASGLPTLQGLQAAFPDVARAALDAALRANMGQSWSERVANFLRTQTGARTLAPREGTDPDAVLSRAEAATAKGDLATALKEIAALPAEGLAAMGDWQARAQLRLDAATAIKTLMTQAG